MYIHTYVIYIYMYNKMFFKSGKLVWKKKSRNAPQLSYMIFRLFLFLSIFLEKINQITQFKRNNEIA
jgi:hypothetical protein